MADYFDRLVLSEGSKKRLGFFLKIEENQLAVFLVLCRLADIQIMLDIGANVGFYTLATHRYFSDIKCIAFEPTPDTFRQLAANISAIESSNIAAKNIAISKSSGTLEFNDYGDFSGKNCLAETSIHGSAGIKNVISVSTERLDELCKFSDTRCILKIDTEGHEFEVLLGSRKILESNQCLLQIETGHLKDRLSIENLLNNYGYTSMFSLGPDQYFTNIKEILSPAILMDVLVESLNFVIGLHWNIEKKFSPK